MRKWCGLLVPLFLAGCSPGWERPVLLAPPGAQASAQTGTTPPALAAADPSLTTDPDLLPEGRNLFYRVREGDTVRSLAGRFRIDPMDVVRLNGLASPDQALSSGARIRLPDTIIRTAAGSGTGGNGPPALRSPPGEPAPPGAEDGNTRQAVNRVYAGLAGRPSGDDPPLRNGVAPARQPVFPSMATVRTASLPPASRLPGTQGGDAAGAGADGAGLPFMWPVSGQVLAPFNRADGYDGITVGVRPGTPVRAAAAGRVLYAGNELDDYGNIVVLDHGGDLLTLYGHNESLLVKKGDRVGKGQVIARSGSSGLARTPQLHFQVLYRREPVSPLDYLPPAS